MQYAIRVSVLHPLFMTQGDVMGPAHHLNMSKDQDALLQALNCANSIDMKQLSATIRTSTNSI
jgi:hypothetical protein